MRKIDLCAKCEKEKGVADPAGFSLADMLLGLGAAEEMKTSHNQELVCPVCGFTQPDFKKTARLGCSQCYQTFGSGLEVILKDMHKGTTHKGKVPGRFARAQIMASKLKDLQDELSLAVQEENYEQAASLRDQILQLESELKS
ncbi:MAG: UvrB/UvrC motif-containing protein [Candidatus Methylacidiphilales bacterium]|nr:UvrB/UvrC motif-containing protein [Candidatus Methylacidiphilales bacterium]